MADAAQCAERLLKLHNLFHLRVWQELEYALIRKEQVLVEQVGKAARLLDLEQDLPCDRSMMHLARDLLRHVTVSDVSQPMQLNDSSLECASKYHSCVSTFRK